MSLVLDTGTMKYRENPNQPWRPLVIKANMNWESMADTYDPDNGTYEIGQYVLEDGVMYRCIYAIDTPETWTPAHWTEINIGDELFSLRDSISSEATTRASEDTLIRNTLSHKADAIYDTASGPIASFSDGAEGLPVKDLTVGIEPVQDLHGYENPWPAGGGKNKLNPNGLATKSDHGIAYTKNSDGSITAKGTASSTSYYDVATNLTLPAGSYILTGGKSANRKIYAVTGSTYSTDTGAGATFITDGTKTYTVTIEIASGQDLSAGVTFNPMVRFSTEADATFAPYSNICPISGWTGMNVYATGKNVFNPYEYESFDITGNGDIRYGHTYQTGTWTITNNHNEGINYRFTTKDLSNYGSTMTIPAGNSATVTVDSTHMLRVFVFSWSEAVAKKICVSSGSDTTFEDFGSKIPISWQSEAGTVYGGTLDVTSGVLTVTMASVDLGTLNPFISSLVSNGVTIPISNAKKWVGGVYLPNGLNSAYKKVVSNELHFTGGAEWTIRLSTDASGILISNPQWAGKTAEQIKEDLSGVYYCYELATPQTYQLIPQEVTTLLGQNNIWADCGPVSVDYPADTKLYIQKINTPTDDDMIADANIASGKYFIINNNLYLSTTAILAGDPIKPGTNCTLTNLAAALNAINS